MVERLNGIEEVRGSNPLGSTTRRSVGSNFQSMLAVLAFTAKIYALCRSFSHTMKTLLLATILLPLQILAAPVDFAREVRPILSENCFTCHGPDSGKRKGEVRLDTKEGALGKGESGAQIIIPGKPAESELIKRVLSTDPEEIMPPQKEHKKIKPAEVELLKRWIAEGANYTGHWAFQKVKQPTVPVIAGAATPIDAFLTERLQRAGLAFSPPEEKTRILRRVTLDLTGLPPTPAEVDAFLADNSPNAYEKAVDRLLASPHFGERMAVPWLDLARYADTGGYHNDSLRDMWMWRDWVVKAFNDNKPFSDFTTEQLAGDLIPNALIEQKVASGFHRNVMTSDEGGIIESEYLNLYVVDRVATTGVTWLGLTVGCAQCHDHKYDPITQRDFYSMYAFFHNVPEKGKDGVREKNPAPVITVPTPDQTKEIARLDGEIAEAGKQIKELESKLDASQAEWEKTLAATLKTGEPKGPVVKFPLDADGNGASDDGKQVAGTEKGTGNFTDGAKDKSYRVDGTGWIEYGDKFGFEKDQPFSVAAWLKVKAKGGSPFGKMEKEGDVRGWDVEFHGTKPSFHLVNKWPGNAIHVECERNLPAETFLHFAITYDGSGKGAGVKMFVNGQSEKVKVVIDKLTDTIKTTEPFSIGRRGSAGTAFFGSMDDLRIYGRALAANEIAQLGGNVAAEIAAMPKDKRTPQQLEQLKKIFRETQSPAFASAQQKIDNTKKTKANIEKQFPNTMVMVEMDKPRDTFIKMRGAYDQDGEKVAAMTPAFLPALNAAPANGKRHTRLDFANWLMSPEHPLTARVAVNRWWAIIFGTGLVKTVNDFGNQGEWPSHPELLDWLAADFQRDWNLKRVIKQMLMTTAYRQSSRITPQHLEKDSENRLLAHGPRNRLDAEFVRDNALAISGLLNTQMGGKGVLPFQPPGIWDVNEMGGQSYKQTRDANQYRRGLYVYWRRSTPYPSFLTFDAPNREFCTAVRARTSTPLQSLVLMNDPVYVEAARALAQKVIKEGGNDPKARLALMWRLAVTRPATEQEQAILQKALDLQIARYAQDAKAAEDFTKVGDLPRPADAKIPELAAWTALANVVLNLNETISN